MLNVLALAASICIILTYLRLARTGKTAAFHWANALGCVPIILQNSAAEAWAALVLTGFFGLIGWFGLITTWSDRQRRQIEMGAYDYSAERWKRGT